MTHPSGRTETGGLSALLFRPYLILVLSVAFWGGNVVARNVVTGRPSAGRP